MGREKERKTSPPGSGRLTGGRRRVHAPAGGRRVGVGGGVGRHRGTDEVAQRCGRERGGATRLEVELCGGGRRRRGKRKEGKQRRVEREQRWWGWRPRRRPERGGVLRLASGLERGRKRKTEGRGELPRRGGACRGRGRRRGRGAAPAEGEGGERRPELLRGPSAAAAATGVAAAAGRKGGELREAVMAAGSEGGFIGGARSVRPRERRCGREAVGAGRGQRWRALC